MKIVSNHDSTAAEIAKFVGIFMKIVNSFFRWSRIYFSKPRIYFAITWLYKNRRRRFSETEKERYLVFLKENTL